MDRNERLLRRIQILGSYGFNLDFSSFEKMCEVVQTDEELEAYFGEELRGYVEDELAVIDLIAGARL